ncbi:MAG: protein kinase [Leptospiraceae bacterium]|nr:protein kinase [Leptospiraceae bacterium]
MADIQQDRSLIEGALQAEKYAIARLISVFEDPRPAAIQRRAAVLEYLREHSTRQARFLGITGTPGSGKSTLIGEIANRLIRNDDQLRVAILAVDPSSHVSGGSILGDRMRTRFPLDEKRLYFRSQASDRELGGVSRSTFQVCRFLHYLFDFVLIETVGIGQNEIEIQYVADRIYLVLQPLGGDQIQFMKAGIMEIPDVFIINKYDKTEAADQSYHALKASLAYARPGETERIRIIRTSAITGRGLDEWCDEIRSVDSEAARHNMSEKEVYYFHRWVRDEYGRTGLRYLEDMLGGNVAFMKQCAGFENAQQTFRQRLRY